MERDEFGKIYKDIYDSTLARDWKARLVFMDMVVLSDKHGVLSVTVDGLSSRTRVPEEIITEAIKTLEAPDPDSNTPGDNGRRIIPRTDEGRGWVVVNKSKYYNRHITEKDREKDRARQQQKREKRKEEVKPIEVDEDNPEPPEPGCVLCPTADKPVWISLQKIAEWEVKYPDMDVPATLEHLANWLTLHPERKIPYGGIHAWLGSCLYRTKARGDYVKREENMDDLIDMSPSKEDLDPHNPQKDGRKSHNGIDVYSSLEGGWVLAEDWSPDPKGSYGTKSSSGSSKKGKK